MGELSLDVMKRMGYRERESGEGLTFTRHGHLQVVYDWYWQNPDDDVLEDAPGAIEDIHYYKIHAAHCVGEDLFNVPVVGYWVALEDVALRLYVSDVQKV